LNLLVSGEAFFYDSETFKYVKSCSQTDSLVVHNSLKIVTVKEGHVGIIYDEGLCIAYKKGRHVFTKATQDFAGFISTGAETFPIPALTTFSADNVELTFNAAITIEIIDPARACKCLMSQAGRGQGHGRGQARGGGLGGGYGEQQPFGQDFIHSNVADQARLHLASIVGHHEYNMAFKATTIVPTAAMEQPAASPSPDGGRETEPPVTLLPLIPPSVNPAVATTGKGGTPAAPTDFRGMLCAEFLAFNAVEEEDSNQPAGQGRSTSFINEMLEKGIKVTKFSIEDVKIMDTALASAMAQAALLDLEQAKARADSNAAVSRADGEAAVREREAAGASRARSITVEAEYKAKIRLAEAEQAEIMILSKAMGESGPPFTSMWSQWKLTKASGEALSNANATVMITPSAGQAMNDILTGGAAINAMMQGKMHPGT